MTRNTILVDVDDVLLKYADTFISHHGITVDDDHSYTAFEEIPEFKDTCVLTKIKAFNDSPYFSALEPVDGAVEAVQHMKNLGYSIVAISSCGTLPSTMFYRRCNLLHVFGDVFEHVETIPLHTSKKPYLEKYQDNARLWIEDNISNYFSGKELNINSVLLTHSFNRSMIDDTIHAVESWNDILALL